MLYQRKPLFVGAHKVLFYRCPFESKLLPGINKKRLSKGTASSLVDYTIEISNFDLMKYLSVVVDFLRNHTK